jgi:hypothetical protein
LRENLGHPELLSNQSKSHGLTSKAHYYSKKDSKVKLSALLEQVCGLKTLLVAALAGPAE